MPYPARVLERGDVARLLAHARTTRHALRDQTIVLLSFKAGLRACEIAGLDWTMVLKPTGRLGDQLVVTGDIAKNGRGRRLPMHPDLRSALMRLRGRSRAVLAGPVIVSERGGPMSARGIVNWFRRAYAAVGLIGCSSHSGRRTFITRSARLIAKAGGSLRDVQELAGHRHLTTTERYIEGDRDAQRRLVRLV